MAPLARHDCTDLAIEELRDPAVPVEEAEREKEAQQRQRDPDELGRLGRQEKERHGPVRGQSKPDNERAGQLSLPNEPHTLPEELEEQVLGALHGDEVGHFDPLHVSLGQQRQKDAGQNHHGCSDIEGAARARDAERLGRHLRWKRQGWPVQIAGQSVLITAQTRELHKRYSEIYQKRLAETQGAQTVALHFVRTKNSSRMNRS